jgi:hypothetical protein
MKVQEDPADKVDVSNKPQVTNPVFGSCRPGPNAPRVTDTAIGSNDELTVVVSQYIQSAAQIQLSPATDITCTVDLSVSISLGSGSTSTLSVPAGVLIEYPNLGQPQAATASSPQQQPPMPPPAH